MTDRFSDMYPNLARWVTLHGWIELGNDGMSPSFVRVLDEGGLIFEVADADEAVNDALQTAEAAVGNWIKGELGA